MAKGKVGTRERKLRSVVLGHGIIRMVLVRNHSISNPSKFHLMESLSRFCSGFSSFLPLSYKKKYLGQREQKGAESIAKR